MSRLASGYGGRRSARRIEHTAVSLLRPVLPLKTTSKGQATRYRPNSGSNCICSLILQAVSLSIPPDTADLLRIKGRFSSTCATREVCACIGLLVDRSIVPRKVAEYPQERSQIIKREESAKTGFNRFSYGEEFFDFWVTHDLI